ncbi:Zinc finger protein 347-like, partial [Homarus americanus]
MDASACFFSSDHTLRMEAAPPQYPARTHTASQTVPEQPQQQTQHLVPQIGMWLQTTEKPYECDECSKRFAQESHLNNHIVWHRKVKRFECEMCNKRFTMESHLDSHMIVHSADKNFKCEMCDKRFTMESHLNGHMLVHSQFVHSEKKRFECPECGKRFTQESHLNSHRFVHSERKGIDYAEYVKQMPVSLPQKTHHNGHASHTLMPNEKKAFDYQETAKMFQQQPYQPPHAYAQWE